MGWLRHHYSAAGALAILTGLAIAPALVHAEKTLVGTGQIPGTATDLSGLTETLSDGTPQNRLGSQGSAIAYTGIGNRYVMASDRGPGETVAYRCRLQIVDLSIETPTKTVRPRLVSTILLRNEEGLPLVGIASAITSSDPVKNLRFDPEGVRVGRQGTIYVSDEYGPLVCEFDAKGRRLRCLPVPAHFYVARLGNKKAETPPKNVSGRRPNRGFEGLAITSDGRKLLAAIQAPLIQDSRLEGDKLTGRFCRIVQFDLASNKSRELVYELDKPSHSICEILAVNDREYLVLERDSKGGAEAKCKRIYLADLTGAADVSREKALPHKRLPPQITAVKKRLFLDLLEARFALSPIPEKIEGLAFGPDLADGRRLLIVTTDNDCKADEPTRFYAFAIDRQDLPSFQPQVFAEKKSREP